MTQNRHYIGHQYLQRVNHTCACSQFGAQSRLKILDISAKPVPFSGQIGTFSVGSYRQIGTTWYWFRYMNYKIHLISRVPTLNLVP